MPPVWRVTLWFRTGSLPTEREAVAATPLDAALACLDFTVGWYEETRDWRLFLKGERVISPANGGLLRIKARGVRSWSGG